LTVAVALGVFAFVLVMAVVLWRLRD